jgi:hypothetical protein
VVLDPAVPSRFYYVAEALLVPINFGDL